MMSADRDVFTSCMRVWADLYISATHYCAVLFMHIAATGLCLSYCLSVCSHYLPTAHGGAADIALLQ